MSDCRFLGFTAIHAKLDATTGERLAVGKLDNELAK